MTEEEKIDVGIYRVEEENNYVYYVGKVISGD
jgi:hypothetical protein